MNEPSQQLRLAEALLFAASEPLSEEALALRLGNDADISELLRQLAESYQGRGVNLVRLAGGWTFRTAPDLAPHLRIERPVARKLSRAAVETVAIIAYHQPVTRAEIEEIRGVALGKGTLDSLMEAGWVRPKGRRMTPGRPLIWVTTKGFLTHFGLDTLADLPAIDELRAAGLLDLTPPVLREEAVASGGAAAATRPILDHNDSSFPRKPEPGARPWPEQGASDEAAALDPPFARATKKIVQRDRISLE